MLNHTQVIKEEDIKSTSTQDLEDLVTCDLSKSLRAELKNLVSEQYNIPKDTEVTETSTDSKFYKSLSWKSTE